MKFNLLILVLLFSFFATSQDCKKSIVYFDSNKDKAEQQFLEHVNSVLEKLSPDTTYLIEIHGHTDEVGDEKSNMKLAAERIQFVENYINSKKLKNIRLLTRNFGESQPISKYNEENRRVEILTLPINSDGTITIHGDGGTKLNVRADYFGSNHCGYCGRNAKLNISKGVEQVEGKLEAIKSFVVESDCKTTIYCQGVEFRFPFEQFNDPAKIKVPRPIYISGCGMEKMRFSKDSIDLLSDYFKRFTTRFDTLTNEYVVSHECFNPSYGLCCRLEIVPCPPLHLYITDSITEKQTVYAYRFRPSPNSNYVDSLVQLGDTNYYHRRSYCSDENIEIIGMGFRNGQLVFMRRPLEKLAKTPNYDSRFFFSDYDYFVRNQDYQPLEYLNSKVRVKLPKGTNAEEFGYYIAVFDYFIPMDHLKKDIYSYKLLNYPYSFGIKKGDQVVSVDFKKPKKKFSKRKQTLKVKIRETDLSG